MVDKIIFTVTPIFSIPPRGAAAVETWMYQVAQRTNFPNRIVFAFLMKKNDFY